jgi:methyl-accepting chemotaxis protein
MLNRLLGQAARLQRLHFLAALPRGRGALPESPADQTAEISHLRVYAMLKLRDIPILGNVYAVVAALGLVALIVGAVGVDAVYTTTARVRQLEQVANRAFFAERANALIYAVVMESRGIYMSSDAADRAKFGDGVKTFLRQFEANMAAWKTHLQPERRERFRRAEERAEEFVRFRTELVRLGNEEGQAAAREWGDNDANRTNR